MPVKKRTDASLDWDDLRHFTALARAGSLSGAGRALNVNHATVARRLGSLERALGEALFDRNRDGYALTPSGERALREAETMERAALALATHAEPGTIAGLVRITTVRTLAESVLIAGLSALHRAYPLLRLEILARSRNLSLARRDADIALRLGRPADGDLQVRKIGSLAFSYYAAAGSDPIRSIEDTAFVSFDARAGSPEEARWIEERIPGARIVFRSNSVHAQASAARAGIGVALLPRYLADGDPSLKRMDAVGQTVSRDLFLLTRRDAAKTARVRLVAETLAVIVAQNRGRLTGAQ